jgi:hypothetical protein
LLHVTTVNAGQFKKNAITLVTRNMKKKMKFHETTQMPHFFNGLTLYIERIKGIHQGHDYVVEHLRSTGLYAKAGTLVNIQVAKEFVGKIKVSICLGAIQGFLPFCLWVYK